MSTAALFQAKAENRAERSLELFGQALLYLSRKYPLVIILDDLHLADETNLNFLLHLIGLAVQSPILFIFAARSQELSLTETPAANWLDRISNQRQLQKLTLGPLITSDIRSLLDKIFEPNSISDNIADKLTQATEGNPFYLIHLLRLMLDEGQISWDRQQWVIETVTEIKVPESVALLIEARLSFLAPEKRQILEKATIFGEVFGFEALRKFTSSDEDSLLKILDDCLRYGLLKEVSAPNASPDDYYSFTQHLLYQVLYERWPKNERKQLHKLAGKILADSCKEHNYHNSAAQQFELAEEWSEAFCHYSTAANLAWRAGEVDLAKNQLKNAQAISEKVPSLAKLLDPNEELTPENQTLATHYCDYLILSVDLKVCDTLAHAEEFMETAVRLAQRLAELILLARVLVAAGHFQQSRGDYMGALNYFERALMIYDQTGNKSRYNIMAEQIKSIRAKLKPQKPTADIF
jgi:predicted ATPase